MNILRFSYVNSITQCATALFLLSSMAVYADPPDNKPPSANPATSQRKPIPPRPPFVMPKYPPQIEITESKVLTPEDLQPGRGFLIKKSNITLDCNGLTLDGQRKAQYGVSIDSQGKPISNIVVKNCTFKDYRQDGINVGWLFADSQKKIIAPTDKGRYALHPTNVLLENNTYLNSGNAGVFVNAYAQNVTIKDSTFKDSKGASVYLEFSSKKSKVLNSTFIHNGIFNREAIAIDSSTDNLIEGNTFDSNVAGGIFLYKNCGERLFDYQTAVIRKLSADRNIIRNNSFKNEKVGVWLASRQSKDQAHMLCQDPVVHDGNDGVFHKDYAKNNRITNNTFCNVDQPIIVEDNDNTIDNNRFGNASMDKAIKITHPPREVYLQEPVIGTKIYSNKKTTCD